MNQRPRSLIRDLCKTGAAERTVLPKRVNVPLLPKETTPSGTEGKPDFPLKVRPNSFFVCFPVTRFSKKEFGRINCPLSPFRFFLPPTAGECVILSLLDSFLHKSFACGERRFISKTNRVWPPALRRCKWPLYQIRELQKTSSSFFILYSESITARVPRLLSSRTEGKPDFPL